MSAINDKQKLIDHWEERLVDILKFRNNLERDDLEYLMTKVGSLRDARLQSCVAGLVGWGDEERAEVETFMAIALATMKLAKPSLIREASRRVELAYHLKGIMRNASQHDQGAGATPEDAGAILDTADS